MHRRQEPRSRWSDGTLYAATIDPLTSGVRHYVLDRIPEGERVLDACCGTGALAEGLAERGRDVVGVDLSPRQIDHARSRSVGGQDAGNRVRYEVGDVAGLDMPSEGPFDVAVIVLSLHEMPADHRAAVVDRLTTVARQVMIVDFAAPMPWNLAGLRNRTAEVLAGPAHLRSFRDYSRRGGLSPLIDREGLAVDQDRRIDAGTLHVLVVSR